MKLICFSKAVLLTVCMLVLTGAYAKLNAQKMNLLVGTYTSKSGSKGIYVYEFDAATGRASLKNSISGVDNPSYLAVSRDLRFVFAVNEGAKCELSSFAFNKKTGALTFINKVNSHGASPCYVSVNKDMTFATVSNYGGGNLAVMPIKSNGVLEETVQVINHQPIRQGQKSHVHSAVFSPDEKYVIVSDLGIDQIFTYPFNKNLKQPLLQSSTAPVTLSPASGPRHFAFHPGARFAYSLQELSGNVTAFAYNRGVLSPVQTVSMLASGYKGVVGAADIHVSPDGRFLYTSNRGEANDIAVFAIDKSTGMLTLTGRYSTLGLTPRNFSIDPTGNFLLAANQNSNTVVVFKRDKKTGQLRATGERIVVNSPVCLKFTSV